MRRNSYKAALLVLAGLGVGVGPAAAQAPPAFAARPAGPSATMARIEMAWQANPITAGCALSTAVNRNVLEIHGEVPNEEARRMALAVARDHCHMPVTDHMKIRPFAVRRADAPAPATVVRTPVAPPVAPTVSRPREVVTPTAPLPTMVLTPTATPATGSGPVAAPEEMHLLRLPAVSATGRPAPTTTTLPASPPRTTQFAATREPALDKAPTTSVAQVTPTVPYPAAKPIEKPVVEKPATVAATMPAPPAKLPLTARGGDEAQDLPAETTKPIPSDALSPEALKGRFKDLSGKLARDVNVSVNLAGDFTVKLVLVSTTAEEQLLPRLLAMPELSTGRIRLEIHVPQ